MKKLFTVLLCLGLFAYIPPLGYAQPEEEPEPVQAMPNPVDSSTAVGTEIVSHGGGQVATEIVSDDGEHGDGKVKTEIVSDEMAGTKTDQLSVNDQDWDTVAPNSGQVLDSEMEQLERHHDRLEGERPGSEPREMGGGLRDRS